MKTLITLTMTALLLLNGATGTHSFQTSVTEIVGTSPWGPEDEIGTLNMMTPQSRAAVLGRADAHRIYDLSVEYFVGMPSWYLLGDPRYQFWLTHTPQGTAVDDPVGVGRAQNDKVAYTGDAVSMYTHTGTHIDALNHFGLNGAVWNGFKAQEHLGDRGWRRAGVEKYPPIVARGVLIDVAGAKDLTVLPDSYRITRNDLTAALARQRTQLQPGDVVLIRGGRMTTWPDGDRYVLNQPGLSLEAARWLAEEQRVMVSLTTTPVTFAQAKASSPSGTSDDELVRSLPGFRNGYAEVNGCAFIASRMARASRSSFYPASRRPGGSSPA